jgi:hypothetical protein
MDWVAKEVLEAVLSDDVTIANKKIIWRRFMTFLDILGYGFSSYELRIFNAWWRAAMQERGGNTEPSEHPGVVLWNGITLVEGNLIRWAEEEIRKLPLTLMPKAIHMLRLQFTVPKETVIRMGKRFLGLAETSRECVKGWWRLLINQAMDSGWLVEEAVRTDGDCKEFARE